MSNPYDSYTYGIVDAPALEAAIAAEPDLALTMLGTNGNNGLCIEVKLEDTRYSNDRLLLVLKTDNNPDRLPPDTPPGETVLDVLQQGAAARGITVTYYTHAEILAEMIKPEWTYTEPL